MVIVLCEIYILIKRSSFLLLFVFAFPRRKVGKRSFGNCFVRVLYFYKKRAIVFGLKKVVPSEKKSRQKKLR